MTLKTDDIKKWLKNKCGLYNTFAIYVLPFFLQNPFVFCLYLLFEGL